MGKDIGQSVQATAVATAQAGLDLLRDALGNALSVCAEVDRVAGITNSSGGGNPLQVAASVPHSKELEALAC